MDVSEYRIKTIQHTHTILRHHDVHIFKNLTSTTGKSVGVAEILIGRFQLFALAAHLAERFVSNLLRRSTQTAVWKKTVGYSHKLQQNLQYRYHRFIPHKTTHA